MVKHDVRTVRHLLRLWFTVQPWLVDLAWLLSLNFKGSLMSHHTDIDSWYHSAHHYSSTSSHTDNFRLFTSTVDCIHLINYLLGEDEELRSGADSGVHSPVKHLYQRNNIQWDEIRVPHVYAVNTDIPIFHQIIHSVRRLLLWGMYWIRTL